MTGYGWIIDIDHFPDGPEGTNSNAKGVIGPRSVSWEINSSLRNGQGIPFRMRDDDGEVMYEGRFIGDADDEEAFGPLWDFGMPNAGCTSIEYKRNGKWEVL